jgi:hypothetical protein
MTSPQNGGGITVWVLLGLGEEYRNWIVGVFRTRQEAMDVRPGKWVPDPFDPHLGICQCENDDGCWEVVPYVLGTLREEPFTEAEAREKGWLA